MKKYTPLVGCLKHNPRHSRFPIPNAVWKYKLKSIEFVLLSYLCCQHSHGSTNVSPEMVAKGAHMTAVTVKKYLARLVWKKLITDEGWSLAFAFQYAGDRKFFTLPNEIFLLRLPPSAFMVYAYLLLIEDRKTHTCHPSYNTIAAVTGLAKNTAMKSINMLLEMGLIAVEPSSYFDKRGMKWTGNNLYTILPTQAAVDQFHQRQLCQLELDAERRRVRRRQKACNHRHSRVVLCSPPAPGTSAAPAT